ncbi:hypothetical protein D3C85_1191940 [compost metagenome]
MALKVGGRAAQYVIQRHQLAGHQAGILQPVAAANGKIEALLHDVDPTVLQVQVQRHLGIAFEKPGNGGGQPDQAEGHGRTDPQGARRGLLHRAQRLLGFVQVIQDTGHLLVVARAGFGQAHAPGRAVQQARGDMGLEFSDVLADRRRRQAQLARRRRKAALLHHLPEYLQRGQMIH